MPPPPRPKPHQAAAVVLTLLSIAFAGCQGEPMSEPVRSSEAVPVAAFDHESGGIEGLVFDDEALPVPSANVSLEGLAAHAVTNEAGIFALDYVPPGEHRLRVESARGSAERVVSVRAGEVARVEIRISAQALTGPRHETVVHNGMWGCWLVTSLMAFTCDEALGTSPTVHRGTFLLDENYTAVLLEMQWRPSGAWSPNRAQLSLRGIENKTHGFHTGVSPVRLLVVPGVAMGRYDPMPADLQSASWSTFAFANLGVESYTVGLVLEQRFQVYSTVFYGLDVPPQFTAIPDG